MKDIKETIVGGLLMGLFALAAGAVIYGVLDIAMFS